MVTGGPDDAGPVAGDGDDPGDPVAPDNGPADGRVEQAAPARVEQRSLVAQHLLDSSRPDLAVAVQLTSHGCHALIQRLGKAPPVAVVVAGDQADCLRAAQDPVCVEHDGVGAVPRGGNAGARPGGSAAGHEHVAAFTHGQPVPRIEGDGLQGDPKARIVEFGQRTGGQRDPHGAAVDHRVPGGRGHGAVLRDPRRDGVAGVRELRQVGAGSVRRQVEVGHGQAGGQGLGVRERGPRGGGLESDLGEGSVGERVAVLGQVGTERNRELPRALLRGS